MQLKSWAKPTTNKIEAKRNAKSHAYFTEHLICLTKKPPIMYNKKQKLQHLIQWLKNNTDIILCATNTPCAKIKAPKAWTLCARPWNNAAPKNKHWSLEPTLKISVRIQNTAAAAKTEDNRVGKPSPGQEKSQGNADTRICAAQEKVRAKNWSSDRRAPVRTRNQAATTKSGKVRNQLKTESRRQPRTWAAENLRTLRWLQREKKHSARRPVLSRKLGLGEELERKSDLLKGNIWQRKKSGQVKPGRNEKHERKQNPERSPGPKLNASTRKLLAAKSIVTGRSTAVGPRHQQRKQDADPEK
jgi:hypothetical protein